MEFGEFPRDPPEAAAPSVEDEDEDAGWTNHAPAFGPAPTDPEHGIQEYKLIMSDVGNGLQTVEISRDECGDPISRRTRIHSETREQSMTLPSFAMSDLARKWASLRREMNLQAELNALNAKLRTVLPEEYQDRYEDVQPVSMGSAALKFDAANRVAWDEIWDHFCDLAMAGGPPHKGKLLEPARATELDAQPDRYRKVVDEICRGVRMVSDLAVEGSPNPGWVRLMCPTEVMAGWLVRAIVMENVSAHLQGNVVELPAGPDYRLEKEIKNVVTAVAKTFHYFDGHIATGQQRRIASLFNEHDAPLLQPCRPGESTSAVDLMFRTKARAMEQISRDTGLHPGGAEYFNWMGLECPHVPSAIWMMRALVVNNTLARREDRYLYVPIHPGLDPSGERIASAVHNVYRLATARQNVG